MKQFFTFLICLTSTFTLFAQVPQAVCYQAVATDQQGRELVSQNIKVRLSILKGSVAGTEEWIETFSITTDGFGLFDLQIGNGTRSGGTQTTLSNIKWGIDKYFLKVEMDITGGSTYVLMGTNQLVSVPYALYTEKAYSSVISDSSRYSTRSGSSGRTDTANFSFVSDSSRRAAIAYNAYNANYANRSGRSDTATFAWLADSSRRAALAYNAYNAHYANRAGRSDTAAFAWLADSARRAATANYAANAGNATNATNATNANYANRAGRSDTATFAWLADSSRRAATANYAANAGNANNATNATNANYANRAGRSDTATFAWLADSARRAAVASYAINAGNSFTANYATRAGRSDTATFAWLADSSRRATYATRAGRADTAVIAQNAVNDFDRDSTNEIQKLGFNNGVLSLSKSSTTIDFNGYALRGAGASIDYPNGILGDALLVTTNYTVPAGKTLFISAIDNVVALADGRELRNQPGMPMIPENTRIASCYCSGILVTNMPFIITKIIDLSQTSDSYTVPANYNLIVKSGCSTGGRMDILISDVGSADIFPFYTGNVQSPRLVVIPEGKTIKKSPSIFGSFILTGYLLQKQ